MITGTINSISQKRSRKWSLVAALVLSASLLQAADIKLNRNFTDDMVIQRDKPAVIVGSADKGAPVTVSFVGQKKTAKADINGMWRVTLDPMPANARGQKLTASAKGKTVSIDSVVIGDVILVARQTSVDIALGATDAGRKAAAMGTFRAISIQTIPAAKPQGDLAAEATTGWAEVSKDSALKMTASAYYLGRDLAADSDVPVGIIDLNLGYAFPLSWLSREALMETEKFYGDREVMSQVAWHETALAAEVKGEPLPKKKLPPSNTVHRVLFPSGGYNAVLNPLKGTALKAVVVQLGNDYPYMLYAAREQSDDPFNRPELNTTYVETYNIRKVGFRMESKTAPRIAREWRKYFGDDNLPFGLIVPPGSDLNTLGQHHREMRELQRIVAEDNPNVGVILPGSENTRYSAQPEDEALLAKRCLSWVQGAVYKKAGVPPTGPLFGRIECSFSEATIHFKEGTAKGLSASGDALEYFEAAGVEGDYTPVKAWIDGETIRVKSDTVNRITRVRYNWNKRPDQGLVNAAGLPAIPFRSEKAQYLWLPRNEDSDLPAEYHTRANEWKKNDVTLINGQMKTHGYGNFTGWIGPAGFRTGPFGPNMGVRDVKKGSPADGKIMLGDVIYSANGNMLGDRAWEVMGAAITDSETKESKGKLVLGFRRDGKNMDVELTLEVMGTYSSTSPFDCPKTEKIVAELEDWLVSKGAGAGFLNTDAIFMLATGNPEMQGYLRRIIYKIITKKIQTGKLEGSKVGKSWGNSAEAFLLGEYYMATGDKNVLGHLKYVCDRLAASQQPSGGWRHNFPGGAHYGYIPNAGLPGVIGMQLARDAGVKINMQALAKGVQHFAKDRAETGFLIYGMGGCDRPIPVAFDTETMAAGKMTSYNGGLSAAGILMRLAGNHRAAHMCSMISAFAWNNTFGGHGGNFWNNFWTPLGAHQHSRQAFINFWKNHRWYRESNRMFDGSLIQHESGKVGAGCGVALVAPRRRIQVVGAPPSPFAVVVPLVLKPALAAYWKKDYAGCEKLVTELIGSGTVGQNDMPTVEYLAQQARDIQSSIDADLSRMKTLAEAGNADEAKSFLAGLKGIMPEGDERLAAIEKMVASAEAAPKATPVKADDKKGEVVEKPREWVRLVSERLGTGGKKKGGPAVISCPEQANIWKISVVEGLSQAPADWTQPKFDDSDWMETELPVSWRMYHTALLRTTFNVEDRKAFDGLRLYAWVFRQQGIEVYLNGELIGKINNIEKKTGDITNEFKESALKHLKNGKNTLAVTTRHNWRWGMLFMKVYNDGFDFNLDARLKMD